MVTWWRGHRWFTEGMKAHTAHQNLFLQLGSHEHGLLSETRGLLSDPNPRLWEQAESVPWSPQVTLRREGWDLLPGDFNAGTDVIKFNFINAYPPAMLAEKKQEQSHEWKLGRNRSRSDEGRYKRATALKMWKADVTEDWQCMSPPHSSQRRAFGVRSQTLRACIRLHT